jgi:hypothetical protein
MNDGQAGWARKVLGMADDEPNAATGHDTREAFDRLIAGVPADQRPLAQRLSESTGVSYAQAQAMLDAGADRRTADRETIARAIYALHPVHKMSGGEWSQATYTWDEVGEGFQRWRDADAVLAVLVPADQVRAETLEAFHPTNPKQSLGTVTHGGPMQYGPGCLLHGSRCKEWLAAAEYRKAAGA